MKDQRSALISRFRANLQARIRDLCALMDVLELMPSDEAALRQVLGELHTLKGESRMLGLIGMANLAHALEDRLRRGGGADTASVLSSLFAMGEALDDRIGTEEAEAILSRAMIALEAAPVAFGDAARQSEPAAEIAERREQKRRGQRWIQVDATLVDELCDRIGGFSAEFGRLQSRVGELLHAQKRGSATFELLDDFARCRSTLDDCTVKTWTLRLVPVEPMLRELAQHTKKLAAGVGKSVNVSLSTGGVQLERDVLEHVWDSLLHLVQNAVDHGIEAPHERADKPAAGALRLSAESMGPSVVIRVEDDGRGIDAARVRSAALARGVIAASAAASLSDEDVVQLIFEHGFSTKDSVSQTSGRGVGLDVVKQRIEALGGTVEVETALGQRTQFSLVVPFAVTKERLLIIDVNGVLYGLPARVVRAVLGPSELPGRDESHATLRHHGQILALRSMARSLAQEPDAPESFAIVVQFGSRSFAIRVARIVGERELIRRPAEALLSKQSGIGASAALDDGRIVLLLELGFLHRALKRDVQPVEPVRQKSKRATPRQHVLVVDDSPVICDLIREILSSAGLSVEVAHDGVAALGVLQRREPDLVLSDVEMPNMNGFDLLAEIRRRSQRLPVIMLTTRGSVEDKRRATTLGANAYVLKTDFKGDALLDVVGRFVKVA